MGDHMRDGAGERERRARAESVSCGALSIAYCLFYATAR